MLRQTYSSCTYTSFADLNAVCRRPSCETIKYTPTGNTYAWQQYRNCKNYEEVLHRRKEELRDCNLSQHDNLLKEWNILLEELDRLFTEKYRNETSQETTACQVKQHKPKPQIELIYNGLLNSRS
eukprot:m.336960 g.336960  ORF g.336960 m.336960 type:complete len:125 (-) comp18003_c0_seq1:128-502(-)